jgi:hypothetical protein
MAARWHSPGHSGRTYCLKPCTLPDGPELPADIRRELAASDTGGILLWTLSEAHLVIPPFPVEAAEERDGWHTGPLLSLLDKPRRVLVVLLRMGGFAIGMFEGERLMSSKVDAPFVKGRHRQGGSSSGRFARRREGQERMLFDKACEVLRAQVEGYHSPPQHLVLGGDRLTLQAFEKRCPYLSRFRSIRLDRVLVDIPDPRLAVLQDAPRLFYASRVLTFSGLPEGAPLPIRNR